MSRGTTAVTGAAVGGAARATSELKTGLSFTAAGAGPDASVEEAPGVDDGDDGGGAAGVGFTGDEVVFGCGTGALDVVGADEDGEAAGAIDDDDEDVTRGAGVSVRIGVGVTDGMRALATLAASRDR